MVRHLLPLLGQQRRRLAGGVLLLAVVVIGLQLYEATPRELRLELVLGPLHREVVEVRVAYMLQGDEYEGTRLSFPGGAPRRIPLRTDLPHGRFEVNVHLTRVDGTGWHRVHPIDVDAALDGPVRVALAE